jgi:hypothetical protein
MSAGVASSAVSSDDSLSGDRAQKSSATHNVVERSRTWSGMWAVAIGDVAIAGVAG